MPTMVQRCYQARSGNFDQQWFCVDASDKVLGRLATRLAMVLMGKHKPTYTPNVDTGDFVVVVNAEKVRVTGSKAKSKTYERYTGYPGGRKVIPYERMIAEHPERVIQLAVKRMLPRNRLGRKMLGKLKIYAGPEHDHQAQCPQPLEF